ncbi:MAG: hypothetical protein KKF62_13525 [Bacteroidetes bacterium]|nr:hypothetical protein [Bacteroidota bacterium]MBU1115299.1 hypothetical protein [Bacteroidota bacterium]MBU1799588.1 hypothetical protein [Bacteroidota bacterium]
MKNIIKVIVIVSFVLSSSSQIIAKDSPLKTKKISYEQIEESLLTGLNSDNMGLKISCSYMLGEIKSKKAISDLTAIVNNGDNDKAKLTAILALLKIASSECVALLNQNEQNDEIRQICENLTNCHSCLTKILDPHSNEEVSAVSE